MQRFLLLLLALVFVSGCAQPAAHSSAPQPPVPKVATEKFLAIAGTSEARPAPSCTAVVCTGGGYAAAASELGKNATLVDLDVNFTSSATLAPGSELTVVATCRGQNRACVTPLVTQHGQPPLRLELHDASVAGLEVVAVSAYVTGDTADAYVAAGYPISVAGGVRYRVA